MSFLFFLRWSLYHPVIILSFLFFSGGCSATLSALNIHYYSRKNKRKTNRNTFLVFRRNSRFANFFNINKIFRNFKRKNFPQKNISIL